MPAPSGCRAAHILRRACVAGVVFVSACSGGVASGPPVLRWYVFDEPSGAFATAARRCGEESGGRYSIEMTPLPTAADQQRSQLVRRLAARDADIDLVGMDVIWVPEFAAAGWILPWQGDDAREAVRGRLPSAAATVRFRNRVWAAPLTTNTQLLWYRTDRVDRVPTTWDDLIRTAESLGDSGTIEVQGARYEGLTVFFTSLLASAGGRVLAPGDTTVALPPPATERALGILKRLATSTAADPTLSTSREDQGRLAFEAGKASFMVNYTYVWPSARTDAPEVARHMAWARWPSVEAGRPSRVTVGGIDVGVGAFTRHPRLAFRAALCLASVKSQRTAVTMGGLPPTTEALYDDPDVRSVFPFADLLRQTLREAVQRARTPLYTDVSLAMMRVLHPPSEIDSVADVARLRSAVQRALDSRGLR
ncbi:MAG: extracellular solute-binding protein [Gemmatimonadetes bacterium]|nr:extracellular solute-binding protein [Gemmatimonadota bacterium]